MKIKRYTGYIILREKFLNDLAYNVRKNLEIGWNPYEGVFCVTDPRTHETLVCQVMVREDEEE